MHTLQHAAVCHGALAQGDDQGAERPGGHVARAGEGCVFNVRQSGARHVGRQGLPQPQAALVVGQRPARPLQVHRRMGRIGHASRLLDQRLLLPAGLPHRHAAELRAQAHIRDRYRVVRLPGHGRPRPRAAGARGWLLHPRPLHGGRAVGRQGTPAGRVPSQGALHRVPHHLAAAGAAPQEARGRPLRLPRVQDPHARRHAIHDWALNQLCHVLGAPKRQGPGLVDQPWGRALYLARVLTPLGVACFRRGGDRKSRVQD
mmetsp:Transcript_16562/g.49425  ORF Transcript_16562/g.49425 Transcript_16562/m.49425 type:complete len:259 (-) Transcript_16562:78-854(-)